MACRFVNPDRQRVTAVFTLADASDCFKTDAPRENATSNLTLRIAKNQCVTRQRNFNRHAWGCEKPIAASAANWSDGRPSMPVRSVTITELVSRQMGSIALASIVIPSQTVTQRLSFP
jgi:hypothetical protein